MEGWRAGCAQSARPEAGGRARATVMTIVMLPSHKQEDCDQPHQLSLYSATFEPGLLNVYNLMLMGKCAGDPAVCWVLSVSERCAQ